MPEYNNVKLKRITPLLLLVRSSKDEKTNVLIDSFVERLFSGFSIFNDNSLDGIIRVVFIKYNDDSSFCNETMDDPLQVHDNLHKFVMGNYNTTETLMNYIEKNFQKGKMLANDGLYYPPISIMLNIAVPTSKESADKIVEMDNNWWALSKKVLFLFEGESSDLYRCLTLCKDAIFCVSTTINQNSLDDICNALMGTWGCACGLDYELIAKDYNSTHEEGLVGQSSFEILQNSIESSQNYVCYGPEPLNGYAQVLKEISTIIKRESNNEVLYDETITDKYEYGYAFDFIFFTLQNVLSEDCLKIINDNYNPENFDFTVERKALDKTIINELRVLYDSQKIYLLSINMLETAALFILNCGSVILLSTNYIWLLDNDACISEGDITIKNIEWNTEINIGSFLEFDYWDVVNEAYRHCCVNYQNIDNFKIEKEKWISSEW